VAIIEEAIILIETHEGRYSSVVVNETVEFDCSASDKTSSWRVPIKLRSRQPFKMSLSGMNQEREREREREREKETS